MNRKIIWLLLAAIFLATPSIAHAQQPAKVPRIGLLLALSTDESTDINGLRQGLTALGYVEGKNLAIEYRSAAGKLDRLPALAAELVNLKVDVIVALNPPAAHAAKNATKTIPIVMRSGGRSRHNGTCRQLWHGRAGISPV